MEIHIQCHSSQQFWTANLREFLTQTGGKLRSLEADYASALCTAAPNVWTCYVGSRVMIGAGAMVVMVMMVDPIFVQTSNACKSHIG
jgi:hypothetical protein